MLAEFEFQIARIESSVSHLWSDFKQANEVIIDFLRSREYRRSERFKDLPSIMSAIVP